MDDLDFKIFDLLKYLTAEQKIAALELSILMMGKRMEEKQHEV